MVRSETLTQQVSINLDHLIQEKFQKEGFFIVENVLSATFLQETKQALYRAQSAIEAEIGIERLKKASELGVLRLMMRFEPHFYKFLEIPEVLDVVDKTLSPTAIMHLQNGFILPSFDSNTTPSVFQNTFHRDFPRYLNGYRSSINTLFAIDAFTEENGATWAVPSSHLKVDIPDEQTFKKKAIPLVCPAGSMIVFDSTLWHAAGTNTSGKDRCAINHQFTMSFFKQQFDYVRALDEKVISALPERSQQLLGYYTRVVTSLDEYYQPEERRLYRKGQG
jgi:ectoine hydroxylase-related dioxygenase (phytanoyl-CoA dioxygenase family)